ncbi:MAG: penicillin-binding protein 2 [Candidatus Moraniibacteriota bacterium]|nr:MAG: penicillin-binding protein 2 [Candidatus Moranbacteria bacterium]
MSLFGNSSRYRGMEIDDAVLTITEKDAARLEAPLHRGLARWLQVFFASVLVLLGARVFFLNVVKGGYYQDVAVRNSVRNVLLSAPRGLIFDRYGKQLVRNVPSMELLATPADLPKTEGDRRALVERLRNIIAFDSDEWSSAIQSAGGTFSLPIVLKSSLTQDEVLLFSARAVEFPGISLERSAVREYQDGLIFSHILGYEGKIRKEELDKYPEYLPIDSIGKQGIEKSYESELRGKRGADRVEVDSRGAIKKALGVFDPEPGNDLILNIDADLQKRLFDSLSSALEKADLRKGAAVAIDPRDGSVLALVSLPSFDNNLFAGGIDSVNYTELIGDDALPLFNRALAGEYPPGSTIKPFLASAALAEGVVTPSTQIESRGGITVAGFSFGDWKAHGFTDVRHAIAVSSDVYFYSVGGGYGNIRGLGMEKMNEYEERFGFGSETGIDISGEKRGLLPTAAWKENKIGERWYIGDTYHASIGQGFVLATPIQLANATAAIANGGTLWKPRVVGQIRSRDGTMQAVAPEALRRNVIDPSILKIVREGMRMTVTENVGTAQSLASLPVAVAGKTGTAQFGAEKKTHGWFESFAPYDHPTIALVVLVEGQENEGYFAVPVTKEVFSWYFTEGKGKEVEKE